METRRLAIKGDQEAAALAAKMLLLLVERLETLLDLRRLSLHGVLRAIGRSLADDDGTNGEFHRTSSFTRLSCTR